MKILLATAFALFGLVVTGPAHAVPIDEGGDTSPCVTADEVLAVNAAFTAGRLSRGQVRRIFDTDGQRGGRAVVDGLRNVLPVADGYEVTHPRHRMVRNYGGCVEGLDPTVYVEFNTRTDNVTFLAAP